MNIAVWNFHEVLHEDNLMFSSNNELNRGEDSLKPFYYLYKNLHKLNHKVDFIFNFSNIEEIDIFVFINYPDDNNDIVKKALQTNKIKILYMYECEAIHPNNYKYLNKFNFCFTWDDSLVDNSKFFKINCPSYNDYHLNQKNNYHFNDKKLLTFVLSKKFVINKYELYSLRENILDFYERNISYDFDFYGFGWNKVNLKNRYLNKLINSNNFLREFFNKKYKNYKGNISGRKEKIIQKYKFCFCIENAKSYNGYITEKIFHCFFAGSIPIYSGCNNISEHIPSNCFIDFNKFENLNALHNFIKNMDEKKYYEYIENIQNFLRSKKFEQFSIDYYVNKFSNLLNKI